MTSREKRVMEAHRLRYEEDLSNKEIANRIGVAESTIGDYFTESDSDKFKRFYSDRELFKLQQEIESEVRDGKKLANNLLARAIQHDDVNPSTMVRATKEAQKIPERHIEMLQELGIIQKPKERREVTQKGKDELNAIAEAYQQEEEGEDAEVQS